MASPGPCADEAPRPVGARDLAVALGLLLAAGLLYGLTLQSRFTGDGAWMVALLVDPEWQPFTHALYPVLVGLVEALGVASPIAAAKWTSVLGGAAGCAGAYLVCRAFGCSRPSAVAGSALVAVTPAVWFFATLVEFHGPHLGVVTLCAVVTLYAPWRRPWLALGLTALVFPLTYLSHQMSVLLGPGWVLLVGYAAHRQGRPWSTRGLLLVVGPLLLGALLAGVALKGLVETGELDLGLGREQRMLDLYAHSGHQLRMVRDGWLVPLALLVPIAALGLWALRRDSRRLLPLAALLAPPLVFLLFFYPVPERGGFFMGSAPFLAVAAAAALRPARLAPLALVAVTVQAFLGFTWIRTFDDRYDPELRAARVRAVLGEHGTLVVGDPLAPGIELYVPGMLEFRLGPAKHAAKLQGLTATQFAETLVPHLEILLATGPLALELSYEHKASRSGFVMQPDDPERPYLDPLRGVLEQRFETTLDDDPSWPLLRLRRRE